MFLHANDKTYTPVCPIGRPHQRSHAVLIHHVHILTERKDAINRVRELKEKSEEEKGSSRAPPDGGRWYKILL